MEKEFVPAATKLENLKAKVDMEALKKRDIKRYRKEMRKIKKLVKLKKKEEDGEEEQPEEDPELIQARKEKKKEKIQKLKDKKYSKDLAVVLKGEDVAEGLAEYLNKKLFDHLTQAQHSNLGLTEAEANTMMQLRRVLKEKIG